MLLEVKLAKRSNLACKIGMTKISRIYYIWTNKCRITKYIFIKYITRLFNKTTTLKQCLPSKGPSVWTVC